MTSPKSLSLYIHIPFCKSKCRYCDFYSVPYTAQIASDYISALIREWRLVQDTYHCHETAVQSLFFGGGTPSILTGEQWKTLCSGIGATAHFIPDGEWTIECNPDSFTEEKAVAWRQSGVNRMTIGVQSLHNRELSFLSRVHTAEQALAVLRHPVLNTFTSVGVDVMYGIPGQTVASLSNTLDQLLSFPVVTHCSVYELTVAEHTPFHRHRTILPLPPEDTNAAMTHAVLSKTRSHGFEQYEVSNFAKPGFACQHNMTYWNLSPYIGLGPGAHSFVQDQRMANSSDIAEYCASIADNHLPRAFTDTITLHMREKEIIFLRLRTSQGLDEEWFFTHIGAPFQNAFRKNKLETYIKHGLIEYNPPFWRCTDNGMLVVDSLARDLMPYEASDC